LWFVALVVLVVPDGLLVRVDCGVLPSLVRVCSCVSCVFGVVPLAVGR